MGLSILNNIPSLVAQNQLSVTNENLQNTLFQLSSGSRLNTGADDPAGLAIANGLQANISALQQSAQNASEGVGNLQVADGALSQVTTLLNRAVTLATEASNGGLSTAQTQALNNEFSSIMTEINQIGTNTTYNGTAVFTGNPLSLFLSDGSATDAVNPTITVNIPTLSATNIGLGTFATATLDLTAQATATDTVTIGGTTYTFTATPTSPGDVLIGTATGSLGIQQTLQNLAAAINGGPGAGTTYIAAPTGVGTATGANPSAQALTVSGGSLVLQSLVAGQGAAATGTFGTAGYVPATGNSVVATTTDADITITNPTDVAGTLTGGSGNAVDLNSTTHAQSALTQIEGAIASVASTRGGIGAAINRLNAAVNVMNNQVQNLTSAVSGIQDANIGTVVANLSKYQILEQTGIASLAQANSQEQAVLKLLQ